MVDRILGPQLPPLHRPCSEFPWLDPVVVFVGTLSDGITEYTQRLDCGLEAAVIRARTPQQEEA